MWKKTKMKKTQKNNDKNCRKKDKNEGKIMGKNEDEKCRKKSKD